jgi:hypothetical protein
MTLAMSFVKIGIYFAQTLPTLLGIILHNQYQPKSCLLHRMAIQMVGHGLEMDLKRPENVLVFIVLLLLRCNAWDEDR